MSVSKLLWYISMTIMAQLLPSQSLSTILVVLSSEQEYLFFFFSETMVTSYNGELQKILPPNRKISCNNYHLSWNVLVYYLCVTRISYPVFSRMCCSGFPSSRGGGSSSGPSKGKSKKNSTIACDAMITVAELVTFIEMKIITFFFVFSFICIHIYVAHFMKNLKCCINTRLSELHNASLIFFFIEFYM